MSESFQKEIPKARVNISLDLHTGGAQKRVELPLKLLVMGDYSAGQASGALAERKKLVLEGFAKIVGPEALNPIEYVEFDWTHERWTMGSPVASVQPGATVAYGSTIREPVGRVHWAGTETATYWSGYMDGAVRAGERAAVEVAALT